MYMELCFWEGSNDDEGHFKQIICIIDQESVDNLLSSQPP